MTFDLVVFALRLQDRDTGPDVPPPPPLDSVSVTNSSLPAGLALARVSVSEGPLMRLHFAHRLFIFNDG